MYWLSLHSSILKFILIHKRNFYMSKNIHISSLHMYRYVPVILLDINAISQRPEESWPRLRMIVELLPLCWQGQYVKTKYSTKSQWINNIIVRFLTYFCIGQGLFKHLVCIVVEQYYFRKTMDTVSISTISSFFMNAILRLTWTLYIWKISWYAFLIFFNHNHPRHFYLFLNRCYIKYFTELRFVVFIEF